MKNMQTFEHPVFGEIRVLYEDGKMMFCGVDVARALGYAQPHKAINRHCRYGTRRTVPHPQTAEKEIEMIFIPEGDVYRLTVRSKVDGAERFESWIFDEVVPSVVKTGSYSASQHQLPPQHPAPRMSTVRYLEVIRSTLKETNTNPYEIAAAMRDTARAYGEYIPAQLETCVDPQLSLFPHVSALLEV